jgi:hypothetical protein
LALKSHTPFSGFPHHIASRDDVSGVLIDREEMLAEMDFLEQAPIIFLDGLPTVKCFVVRRHKNRVLREQSGGGSSIVVEVCIVSFLKERIKLLPCL